MPNFPFGRAPNSRLHLWYDLAVASLSGLSLGGLLWWLNRDSDNLGLTELAKLAGELAGAFCLAAVLLHLLVWPFRCGLPSWLGIVIGGSALHALLVVFVAADWRYEESFDRIVMQCLQVFVGSWGYGVLVSLPNNMDFGAGASCSFG